MLKALDKVSGYQQIAGNLAQKAVTDPGSVDIHDITIAQAEAAMSLNITRNMLNRIVQGWRDIINTR
jgi:flagellar hook-basal body complex protein FliE